MKEFKIKVTLQMAGSYKGTLSVRAKTIKEAKNKIQLMSEDEIDVACEWDHNDDYVVVPSTLKLDWKTLISTE